LATGFFERQVPPMRLAFKERIAFTPSGHAQMGESRPEADDRETEEELLALCRRGDMQAQRALYDREVRTVRRIARFLGLTSEEELDDVTQDVFVTTFSDIGRVRPGELSAWLFRITSNKVTDRHRRRRVREAFMRRFGPADQSLTAESEPEQQLHRNEAVKRVSYILSRMRPKKRDVFALFELEGLSGDQIATRLHIPAATVRTRLFHARREFERLARSLERCERDRDSDS
jgi:RNA polymerase sigma-70 factor, ECF subfamily